jgi:DNA-binding YbaB/EbfC family protein
MIELPPKGSMTDLLKQAQEMQSKLQRAQDELTNLAVVGESGAGWVKIKMNGRHHVLEVKLKPELFDEDIAMIEGLIAAAYNNASQKIEGAARHKMVDLTKAIGLPPGFELPPEGGGESGEGK